MVKAEIKGKEVSYDQGEFACDDPAVLSLTIMLSEQFDQLEVDYHPMPDLQRMEWICSKIKGSIIFADQPDQYDQEVEY